MQSARIDWKHSIFTRLIITFLLFVIPIFIFGIGIFQWSRNQMADAITTSMATQLSNNMQNFENDIQRIVKIQSDLMQDDDLNKISNETRIMDDFEQTRAVLRVQQRLTAVKNSSEYIEYVSVLIPSMDRVLFDTEYANGRYRDLADGEVAELCALGAEAGSQVLYAQGKLYLLSTFPSFYDAAQSPLFVIQIFLSRAAVEENMLQLDNRSDTVVILEKPSQGFTMDNLTDQELQPMMYSTLETYREKHPEYSSSVKIVGKDYLLGYTTSSYLDMTLALFLPEDDALVTLHTLELWYWAFFLLVFLFIIGYSFFFTRLLKKPMDALIRSFGKIEGGDFDIKLARAGSDELGYLQDHFIRMVENLRILIDQVYRQKILAQKAELKQLQSQINPHFLYNSFFILHRKIMGGDYENASLFSKQLGNYFKFITRNDSDEVDLAKEVAHARIYADIQAMRFRNRIKVDFAELPSELEGFRVPRLILQPILENAFEHGLEHKKRDGFLRVGITWEAHRISIIVEENGDDLTDEVLSNLERALSSAEAVTEITGMLNIHYRIQMRYGADSGLSTARSDLGGLKVTIVIQTDGGA